MSVTSQRGKRVRPRQRVVVSVHRPLSQCGSDSCRSMFRAVWRHRVVSLIAAAAGFAPNKEYFRLVHLSDHTLAVMVGWSLRTLRSHQPYFAARVLKIAAFLAVAFQNAGNPVRSIFLAARRWLRGIPCHQLMALSPQELQLLAMLAPDVHGQHVDGYFCVRVAAQEGREGPDAGLDYPYAVVTPWRRAALAMAMLVPRLSAPVHALVADFLDDPRQWSLRLLKANLRKDLRVWSPFVSDYFRGRGGYFERGPRQEWSARDFLTGLQRVQWDISLSIDRPRSACSVGDAGLFMLLRETLLFTNTSVAELQQIIAGEVLAAVAWGVVEKNRLAFLVSAFIFLERHSLAQKQDVSRCCTAQPGPTGRRVSTDARTSCLIRTLHRVLAHRLLRN
jgi:hypothetical protein